MAVPLYSSLLLSETGFEGEAAFEVPEGITCVVRDIDAVAGISVGGLVWAYDTSGAQFWAYEFGTDISVKQWQGWRGRQIIPGPGYFYVSSDFVCDFRASGYLLSQSPA